jgi:signal transduction histidine kinase
MRQKKKVSTMQTNGHYDILIATISGTLLFLLLVSFTVVLLMINRKKKLDHKMEKQRMKTDFEKQLLQSQLEIQEQSFSHISREIHDNVGQVLSLVTMQLNILEHSDQLNRPVLEEAQASLNKSIVDLRDIAKGLSTDRITRFNLQENLAGEVSRLQRGTHLLVEFQADGKERPLGPEKTLILFRIIQECLQNIIKHARARTLFLVCKYGESDLQILIQDDGRGFDVSDAVGKSEGLGLSNISNRAAMIGGKLMIESTMQKGTKIHILVPYV